MLVALEDMIEEDQSCHSICNKTPPVLSNSLYNSSKLTCVTSSAVGSGLLTGAACAWVCGCDCECKDARTPCPCKPPTPPLLPPCPGKPTEEDDVFWLIFPLAFGSPVAPTPVFPGMPCICFKAGLVPPRCGIGTYSDDNADQCLRVDMSVMLLRVASAIIAYDRRKRSGLHQCYHRE